MAVRKRQHASLERRPLRDHAIGTGDDLFGRLAAGAAVEVDVPPGPLGAHLVDTQSVVVAIVPFRNVRLDNGSREAREFRGAPRALRG